MTRAALFTASTLAFAASPLIACSAADDAATGSAPASLSSVATATLTAATSEPDAPAPAPVPAGGQPAAPGESVARDEPARAEVITEAVSPEERCEHAYIVADIDGAELDHLNYCDGQWALLTKAHTDWVAQVFWDGTAWVVPEFDGHTTSGLSRGCYLPETFEETGQPPLELQIVYCGEDAVLHD